MNILVCVKQIADPETQFEIDSYTHWIRQDSHTTYRMNRFDEYVLEEALLIKESHPNVTVDVISVGPNRVSETIVKAMGKGAQNGVHILQKKSRYISSFDIAALIASFAKNKGYDLILTGVMSEDNLAGQTGPYIASMLDIPCISAVIKTNIDDRSEKLIADAEMEGGLIGQFEIELPAVLTIQSGINFPRYPSLSKLLRAISKPLHTIDASEMTPSLKTEEPVSISYPSKQAAALMLSGTPEEKAIKLLNLFNEKSILHI